MAIKPLLCLLFSGVSLLMPAQAGTADRTANDSLYFSQKKALLTATWNQPFSYSATHSKHAPLGPYMGNGDVGVTTFTSDNSQTFRISKVDFVTDNWADWAGTGAAALPVGAVSITANTPVATGFSYQMDQLSSELRMTTATAWPVSMVSWMSMDENIFITELTTTSPTPISITVETYADCHTPDFATTAGVNGTTGQVTRRTKTEDAKWVSQAGISTRIVDADATSQRLSDAMVRSEFRLSAGDTVRVAVCVSGGGRDNGPQLDAAAKRLQAIDRTDIARLKAGHDAWWKDMWERSYVETYDELLNRHYLSSIYLLASAYNRHSPVSGGMYGVWNMDDNMNYHGDIHLNYNSQAGFYSVFSANRPEIALPYYKSIELLIPEGQRRAREDMGSVHPSLKGKSCRGLLLPVSALGIGEVYCQYWQQTVNAPFSVPLFSWYYEYTGDVEFLRRHAYPYIKLCGDFYEDYLQKEPYNGSYRYTIITGAHENSWDVNPSSDLAFVEQTFSLLLKYSRLLGVDTNRRKKWQDIVTHLPAYKVIMPTKTPNQGLPVYAKNEDGWDWPNHVIQLHPVYPCEVLNLHSDSTALQIARNTLYYYEVDQKGFTHCMNELGLSAFVMGARMGFDPNILIDKMKELIKTARPNFLITDGHHCAEKTTVIETINSMMLQSVEGVLHLFPCWPARPASFTRLRTKGAFIVSADYDGTQVTRLEITSEKGSLCQIKQPRQKGRLSVSRNGKAVAVKTKNGICTFPTVEGGQYVMTWQP